MSKFHDLGSAIQFLNDKGFFHISERTMNGLRTRGKKPAYLKLAGRIYYTEQALEDFIAGAIHNQDLAK